MGGGGSKRIHDVLCGSSRRIRLQTSHDQDVGFEFPFADRPKFDCRGVRRSLSNGLHLFRDGVLGLRRELLNLRLQKNRRL